MKKTLLRLTLALFAVITSLTAAGRPATPAAGDGGWKDLGTGRYRDDMVSKLYLVENYEFDVKVQESTTKPGLYRLVSPYTNYPYAAKLTTDTYMVIDATDPDKVFFTDYDTGVDMGYPEKGTLHISSVAGDLYQKTGSLDQAVAEGACGTLKDGEITFPKNTLLIRDNTLAEGIYRTCNDDGLFRLRLPGAPELEVAIVNNGLKEQDGRQYISVNFTLGKDLDKARVAMVEGDYNDALYTGIVDGTLASVEMTESGEHLFPFDKDGVYTFVAVPYYKGEPKKVCYSTDELTYINAGWKALGTATYTDGYLADQEMNDLLGLQVQTMDVPIQESTDKPGLFRLVDPYGPGTYPYANNSNYDTSHRYYMEIDASDPDRVVVNEMSEGCGLELGGLGKMTLSSKAWQRLQDGYTPEEVEKAGLYGTLRNNVITFPNKALYIWYLDFVTYPYYANATGKFRVVLPENTGISAPRTTGNGAATTAYYTLSGVRVDADRLTPGVYVKKQGNRSDKIVIRR